ncbi:DUF2624 family protein [Halalkalibacter urbisdiaboli]|uniref:DUF2624 family protein n=1 Tax=Halalkalibacter urbisdiaboli TaxID=1960589 RepID=UPI000B431AF5|nr:DUF2624 family protein [Halalkalibacter urbisdiaboli]
MNAIMQQLINQKVNSLTPQDLLDLASQHQIQLNQQQAEKVVSIIKSEKIDVANQDQIHHVLNRLQNEIDEHVSNVINQLLQQFSHYLS